MLQYPTLIKMNRIRLFLLVLAVYSLPIQAYQHKKRHSGERIIPKTRAGKSGKADKSVKADKAAKSNKALQQVHGVKLTNNNDTVAIRKNGKSGKNKKSTTNGNITGPVPTPFPTVSTTNMPSFVVTSPSTNQNYNDDTSNKTNRIGCDAVKASYGDPNFEISIEIQYTYHIEADSSTKRIKVVRYASILEQRLLKDLAADLLNCNGSSERRSLQAKPTGVKVYAVDPAPYDTVSQENCEAENEGYDCYVVNGAVTLIVDPTTASDTKSLVYKTLEGIKSRMDIGDYDSRAASTENEYNLITSFATEIDTSSQYQSGQGSILYGQKNALNDVLAMASKKDTLIIGVSSGALLCAVVLVALGRKRKERIRPGEKKLVLIQRNSLESIDEQEDLATISSVKSKLKPFDDCHFSAGQRFDLHYTKKKNIHLPTIEEAEEDTMSCCSAKKENILFQGEIYPEYAQDSGYSFVEAKNLHDISIKETIHVIPGVLPNSQHKHNRKEQHCSKFEV